MRGIFTKTTGLFTAAVLALGVGVAAAHTGQAQVHAHAHAPQQVLADHQGPAVISH
ncbi:hypothetical protein [Streptomyces sp. NBC_01431]|uniref:hypothetical protein n=1 Tax=Streptomyces sp. NBC_01431 TaxID=2903863 RepID=UPI002E32D5F6|nr:hypothetical protein [Streptomyces sp. NBC_01431]